MANKIKTISGEEAFKAIEGKTIRDISPSSNSVHIYLTDGSYLNIEFSAGYSCSGHGDEYCYCGPAEVDIEPYFSEKK